MVFSDTSESDAIASPTVAIRLKAYPPQPLSHQAMTSYRGSLKPYPLRGQILTYCVSNGTSTG
jgi:hypothetical protein